jgi:serine/threonine protein kinase
MTAPSLGTWLGGALLRARLLDLPAPRLQDRYAIRRILGQGASGIVVLALDERLQREVALKLAPRGHNEEATLNEGRALARLTRPPYVVQVLEAGAASLCMGDESRDVVFLLMERATGITLREWHVATQAHVVQRLEVLARVAVGIDFVHQHGIIHGDVKPENVMVAPNGEPLIVDFGFAAPIRKRTEARASIVGTQPYLAPEARRGRMRRKGDVYALSVMCWELLTGVHPFGEWREPRLKWYGALETLPFESTVPEALRAMLRKGMHPWPQLRPTAREIADVLAATVRELAAHRPGRSRRWPKWLALAAIIGGIVCGVFVKRREILQEISRGEYSVTLDDQTSHLGRIHIVRLNPQGYRATVHLDDAGVWIGPVEIESGHSRVHLKLHQDRCERQLDVYLIPWLWRSEGTIAGGCPRNAGAPQHVSIERTF